MDRRTKSSCFMGKTKLNDCFISHSLKQDEEHIFSTFSITRLPNVQLMHSAKVEFGCWT